MKLNLILLITFVVIANCVTARNVNKLSEKISIEKCNYATLEECDAEKEKCDLGFKQCKDFKDECDGKCDPKDEECKADCFNAYDHCIAQGPFEDCKGDWEECACECGCGSCPESTEKPPPKDPEECDKIRDECLDERKQCTDFMDECVDLCPKEEGEERDSCVGECEYTFSFCIAQGPFDDCEGDWEECTCNCKPGGSGSKEEPSVEVPSGECSGSGECGGSGGSKESGECPGSGECGGSGSSGSSESGSSSSSSEENDKPPECPCGGDDEDEVETPEEEEEWNGDDPDDPFIKPYDPCTEWPDMEFVPDLRNCHYYWTCINGEGYKFKCPPGWPVFDWRRQMCVKGKRKRWCDRPFCGKQDRGRFCGRRIKSQCKKYRQCLNGTVIPLMCAEGYSFDDVTERCEKDWIADCLNCPIFDDDHDIMKFPNRKDCNGYYVCSRSNFYPMNCAPNLHYGEERKRCESAATAQCKYTYVNEDQKSIYGPSYYAMLQMMEEKFE